MAAYSLVVGEVTEVLQDFANDAFDALLCDPPYFLEFMGKAWDKAGATVPVEEQVFRAWFAGLVAGEGYFRIHKVHGGESYACHFGIHMRQDEAPLLRALQKRIGAGQIQTGGARDNGKVQSAPDVRWIVQSRADCRKIANILDGQPLYAKKQREYDLWRQALEEVSTKERGNRWEGPSDWTKMANFYEMMKDLRPYDEDLAKSTFNPFGSADYLFHCRWLKESFRVLKPGAPLVAFGGSRTWHRLALAIEDTGFELRDTLLWLYGKGFPKSLNLKGDWDGWGTALKPAFEPIVLARKPLEGTVAQNVARWGVGGLAIDACRIGNDGGRWPANLLLDEEAAALLDAEGSHTKSIPFGKGPNRDQDNVAEGNVLPMKRRTAGGYSDGGGPSRFFYCAKVSTKEREAGCEGLPKKTAGEATDREDGSDGLNSPRAGAGRTGGAHNHHPTLKPLSLTTWLARLICPPTPGVILVPFAGAGSEMIGCVKAGWSGVFGIEREADYVNIARARLAYWCSESEAA